MTAGDIVRDVVLAVAAIPFIYYMIVLWSSVRFFGEARREAAGAAVKNSESGVKFQPPVSNLKPVHGLDPEAYENYASFCRQEYPEYEILFCVGGTDDPAYGVLERIRADFPRTKIRIIVGNNQEAVNDKVSKLARLVDEAAYEHLVISDSDVRVGANYLTTLMAPLKNPKVGAATCFYVPAREGTLVDRLQDVGMLSDFYPGILVAKELDGVKFALGPTIATTKARLAGFGGYAAIENKPADDLLVGRMIAEQGVEVKLLATTVGTVPDYGSLRELFVKRLRWMTVMRHMRAWGHLGLIFTLGLPWVVVAVAVAGGWMGWWMVAAMYVAAYVVLRSAITVVIGGWGLGQRGVWGKLWLIPVWDGMATLLWLVSFTRKTIRWRGREYRIVGGSLVRA
jgi:ceramide glucosyltransferase